MFVSTTMSAIWQLHVSKAHCSSACAIPKVDVYKSGDGGWSTGLADRCVVSTLTWVDIWRQNSAWQFLRRAFQWFMRAVAFNSCLHQAARVEEKKVCQSRTEDPWRVGRLPENVGVLTSLRCWVCSVGRENSHKWNQHQCGSRFPTAKTCRIWKLEKELGLTDMTRRWMQKCSHLRRMISVWNMAPTTPWQRFFRVRYRRETIPTLSNIRKDHKAREAHCNHVCRKHPQTTCALSGSWFWWLCSWDWPCWLFCGQQERSH